MFLNLKDKFGLSFARTDSQYVFLLKQQYFIFIHLGHELVLYQMLTLLDLVRMRRPYIFRGHYPVSNRRQTLGHRATVVKRRLQETLIMRAQDYKVLG